MIGCWYIINVLILIGCEESVFYKYYNKLLQVMRDSSENKDLVQIVGILDL